MEKIGITLQDIRQFRNQIDLFVKEYNIRNNRTPQPVPRLGSLSDAVKLASLSSQQQSADSSSTKATPPSSSIVSDLAAAVQQAVSSSATKQKSTPGVF